MNKLMLVGVAAALGALAPATAQSPPPQIQGRIDGPDRHLQVHNRTELGGHIRTLFAELDSNRDGFLTRDEAQSARKTKGERAGRRAVRPLHRDGAAGTGMATFDRLDIDRNGAITREEFASATQLRKQRRTARLEHGNHRGGRMMGALRGRMFEVADVDRDSRVSIQEATNAAYRHFDSSDLNRDGRLTREERMQGRQRARAERRPG